MPSSPAVPPVTTRGARIQGLCPRAREHREHTSPKEMLAGRAFGCDDLSIVLRHTPHDHHSVKDTLNHSVTLHCQYHSASNRGLLWHIVSQGDVQTSSWPSDGLSLSMCKLSNHYRSDPVQVQSTLHQDDILAYTRYMRTNRLSPSSYLLR